MAIRVSSYEEVSRLIAGNPLRNFPSQAKGRDRLFPVPRPRITTGRTIPADASFFCIGSCFARSIEWALECAGRRVLSSRTGLGLPGSFEEQFNRYNVSNTDVALNEIKWSLGSHTAHINAPLVKISNLYADLQIHWSFAHSEDEAQAFRHIFSQSFKSIADADVVTIFVGSIRQWFDVQHGTYINSMPPAVLTRAYPGRFVMHEFDVEESANRLREAVRTISGASLKTQMIFLAVSPGWESLALSGDDALVDQVRSRAIQRAAVDIVCGEFENVLYLPAWDTALLGDALHTYEKASPSHVLQNLADRVVADILTQCIPDDDRGRVLSARAFGNAELMSGNPQRAVQLCEPHSVAGMSDPDFAPTFIRALAGVGRQADAIGFLLRSIEQGTASDPQRHWEMAVRLVKPTDTEIIARLRLVGAELGADERYLTERLAPRQDSRDIQDAINEAAKHLKERNFASVLAVLRLVEDRRSTLLPRLRERYDLLMLQALRGSEDITGAALLVAKRLREEKEPSPILFKQVGSILTRSKSADDIGVIDELREIAEKVFSNEQKQSADIHAGFEKLKTARKRLQIRAGTAHL